MTSCPGARADDVGGVWRDNTYPGAACDVPSHLYSFSFAPEGRWSKRFAEQPEIHGYLQRVATELGVLPHVRFGAEVDARAGTTRGALDATLAAADRASTTWSSPRAAS